MALITHLLDVEEEQVPCGDLACGVVAHGPGVDQSGVDHHQTDDGAQEDVAAEDAGGGDGHQHRQQGEGGVGHQVQEGIPVRGAEGGPELGDGFHKTHHQAGGHNGGQDGDEHVAGGLQDLFPQGHAGSGGSLYVRLGGGGKTGDGKKLIVNLVDGAGTDDELKLSVGVKQTLYALHLFQSLGVDLAVVGNDQAEAGGTVCRADDVVFSAQVGKDLLSAFTVVKRHIILSFSK